MMNVENHVGRLIEVRFVWPITVAELSEFERRRALVVQSMRNRIVCMDLRKLEVLPPELSERIFTMLRRPNPTLLRNATLLSDSKAVLSLQIARILRESDNSTRQSFKTEQALTSWLGEVMTAAESERLETFLASSG